MEFNGTFLATIVTFVVFVFVMNKILYAPILGIMDKRKTLIDTNYQTAKDNEQKSEQILTERESQLGDARVEARAKYAEKISEFKDEKASKIQDAQNLARENLESSNVELKRVSDEVKDGLKGSMAELASDIVEKVIGYRSEVKEFDANIVNTVLWGDK